MNVIKGAIFDMDGMVVDNHRYHFGAWMVFSERHKFKLNEDIYLYLEKYNGKINTDILKMIFGDILETELCKYVEEKERLYQSLYRDHMKAHAGLIEFLEYLQKQKIKIALGTSAPTQNVDFILDTLRLRKYFTVIVDGLQVDKDKPDPQVYLLCSHKLGLEPKDCVVFEDALAGLESATRAMSLSRRLLL
jgi:beta-phosphoglucomutase